MCFMTLSVFRAVASLAKLYSKTKGYNFQKLFMVVACATFPV